MQRSSTLLLLAAFAGLAACDIGSPAEVRSSAQEFPVTANWSSSAQPVSPSTVTGVLTIQQRQGNHMDASFTVAGAPSGTYQWRVFRGDCATNVPAASNTAPTGLALFATVQSYPDLVVGSSGTTAATPSIAGILDSLTAYSVRVRTASANWNGTNPIACGNLQRTPAG